MSGALRMMLSFNDYVIFKFYFLLTFKAVSFNMFGDKHSHSRIYNRITQLFKYG